MMRWLHAGLALVATVVVTGCAVTPKENLPPVVIHEPAAGTGVVYFFRPQMDAVDVASLPALVVDGRRIAVLEHASYTAIALRPGPHRVVLASGPSDSADWNQVAEINVADGALYYIALWHQNQPVPTPGHMLAYGLAGALFFQALNAPLGRPGARFEPVERGVAEFALAGLRFVPPLDASFRVQ